MNDEPSIPSMSNIAALLRAAADNELSPEQRARLDAHLAEHPEHASCIEFERELKSACARSMDAPKCPDALRAKLEAMRSAPEIVQGSDPDVILGGVTNQRSFWQRGGLMGAMAAALVLAGGALLWNSSAVLTSGSGIQGSQTTQVSYAERVGDFVAREHTRCSVEAVAQNKFVIQSIDEAVERYSDTFGSSITKPICENGVTFYGGGDCHVPSTSGSAHLRFDAQTSSGDVTQMSLFISPDPGLLELEESVTYVVDSQACAEKGANLFVWINSGVMYVLVSEAAPGTSQCSEIRSMMQAPSETRGL